MSKEKQIDEISKLICAYPQCIHHNIIGECANAECQTVDIAENLYKQGYLKVIRCKDCLFWEAEAEEWGVCHRPFGDYRTSDARENDFCSYAEGRADNEK